MQSNNKNSIDVFLALVRAGLWEKEARLSEFNDVDYNDVLRLAEEQTVVGLLAAGIEHVADTKITQELALTFAGSALQIEQKNIAMNQFVSELVAKMRKADIYTLLVKGQGIAQCYERPLWRCCGDVDLLLSDDNYRKAKSFLMPLAQSIEQEFSYTKHLELTIDSWSVELHGNLRSELTNRIDKVIDEVQHDVFYQGKVRSWMNGQTQVFLPGYDSDAIFIFVHYLQHYYKWGIGLRQICDWCRLLWTYRGKIDIELLENRLKRMGILSEWKSFAYMAVNMLGMPPQSMPLYSPDEHWKRNANKILKFILEMGNMGQNNDVTYYSKKYIIRKTVSFWRHTKYSIRHLSVFPFNTISIWVRMLMNGVKYSIKGI